MDVCPVVSKFISIRGHFLCLDLRFMYGRLLIMLASPRVHSGSRADASVDAADTVADGTGAVLSTAGPAALI